jgi:hypothetical protein
MCNRPGFVANVEALTVDTVRAFGYSSLHQYDEIHGDHDNYLTSMAPLVFYRLGTPTGLFTVCKQTSSEIREAIDTLLDLVHSSINRNRVKKNPDARFLDICSRSCFALRTEMLSGSFDFLHQLPPTVKPCIHQISIGLRSAYSVNLSNRGLLALAFQILPNLTQVAMLVDSYKNSSSQRMLAEEVSGFGFLRGRQIDVLRLMYQAFSAHDLPRRCPYIAEEKVANMDIELATQKTKPPLEEYIELRELLSNVGQQLSHLGQGPAEPIYGKIHHKFEEWPEMSTARKWAWTDATTVVKFTRADEINPSNRDDLRHDFESKFFARNGLNS